MGKLRVRVISARNLVSADTNGFSDPYMVIAVAGEEKKNFKKTATIKKTLNPSWNESFEFELGAAAATRQISFNVYDWDMLSSHDPLGTISVPVDDLFKGEEKLQWYTLHNTKHGDIQVGLTALDFGLDRAAQQHFQQQQQGFPQQQQQGFPPQQHQGFPPQPQQGFPPQQQGFPPQQGYPQQQGFPPQQGYPPQQQQQQGYDQGYHQQQQQQGYYPQQGQGYPQQGYPAQGHAPAPVYGADPHAPAHGSGSYSPSVSHGHDGKAHKEGKEHKKKDKDKKKKDGKGAKKAGKIAGKAFRGLGGVLASSVEVTFGGDE